MKTKTVQIGILFQFFRKLRSNTPSSPHNKGPIQVGLNLLLVLLLVLTGSGIGQAASVGAGAALVRIELQNPGQDALVAALAVPVHARLYAPDGGLSLLAFANPDQQSELSRLGLQLSVLDAQPQGKTYHLGWQTHPAQIEAARALITGQQMEFRQLDPRQILFSASPDLVQALLESGLKIKPLSPTPLPLTADPLTLPEAITPDPIVQGMIDQVNSSDVYNLDGSLSGEWPVTIGGSSYTLQTRHSGNATASEKATQYAYEYLAALGLDVAYHTYNHPNYGSRRNVVAEQVGDEQPERVFLITAHIDDMPSGATAPGADDNASGSVGVMLAASILSQYNFDCTLRYLLVTGEEQGLYGSYYYAQSAFNAGDDIDGVLNLDMIAYNSDSLPILDLHTRPGNSGDLAIANTFVDVVNAYDLNLTPQIFQDGMGYSDHDSFWDFGFPAILAIEDDDDFTPYYHTVNDKLSTLNLSYFTDFVKAAVGTLAHMGCLAPPLGALSGTVTAAAGDTPLADAVIEARQSGALIDSTTSAADGSYHLDLLEGTYTIKSSKFGYIPQTVSNVVIVSDGSHSLDFALNTCAPFTEIDIQTSHASAEVYETVSFSALVSGGDAPFTYLWDFGDGASASGAQVSHSFTVSKTHTIELSVTNCAASASTSDMLWVYGVPHIKLTPASMTYSLDKGGSTSSPLLIKNTGGENLTWSLVESPAASWLSQSKSSATTLPTQTSIVLLTFNAPTSAGIYTTSLLISSNDPDAPVVNFPIQLTVPGDPLTGVDFSYSPAAPRVGETVTFTATLSGGDPPVTYAWDFGDGGQASGAVVSHVFSQEGALTVRLQATNLANSVQTSQILNLLPGCAPISGLDFTYGPLRPFVNAPVTFNANLISGSLPIVYSWSFGDGNDGSGASAEHRYPGLLIPSEYSVTLTATNACSAPSVQQTVSVLPYGILLPMLNR